MTGFLYSKIFKRKQKFCFLLWSESFRHCSDLTSCTRWWAGPQLWGVNRIPGGEVWGKHPREGDPQLMAVAGTWTFGRWEETSGPRKWVELTPCQFTATSLSLTELMDCLMKISAKFKEMWQPTIFSHYIKIQKYKYRSWNIRSLPNERDGRTQP